jgi:hypothetical protein
MLGKHGGNSWQVLGGLPSNNSFKPKPLRSSKNHGKKSLPCFCFHYAFRLNSSVRRRGEGSRLMQARSGIVDIPELNVAIFSFLLNFIWEMWQIPFFLAIPSEPHWAGVVACTQATFGDAAISLVAFWSVAAFARSRRWILQPSPSQIGGFIAVGVVITIAFETLAAGFLERWNYSPLMPTLPILGTGLVPLLQWILLPPLTIWFVRRQLT